VGAFAGANQISFSLKLQDFAVVAKIVFVVPEWRIGV